MSDLHIGYHNQVNELHRWIDLVNKEAPDVVLISGDIIDRSIRPINEQNMEAEFRRLHAPVYACLGNHEYYSGIDQAEKFLRQAGIHLLRDSSVVFRHQLTIIGRDDRTNPHRRNLKTITARADLGLFTVLLDHQPYHLEQAENCHIDLQLSGHVHYGQLWPVSWITNLIYECAYGSHRRNATQYYISSGMGLWGGKFRIGTCSEYVVVNVHSKKM